jgi:hypothetical protein
MKLPKGFPAELLELTLGMTPLAALLANVDFRHRLAKGLPQKMLRQPTQERLLELAFARV